MQITWEHELGKFNSTLARYAGLRSRTTSEILEHKGRDLSIKLFQGFRSRRWKGARKGQGGIAWKEMRRRTKGRADGISLRPGIQPSPDAPSFMQVHHGLSHTGRVRRVKWSGIHASMRWSRSSVAKAMKIRWPHQPSEHQRKVYGELMLRQQGISVLGASFLWYRRRSSQAQGTYYVRNKSGRQLGYVQKGDTYLRIVGVTEGLSTVDRRYGIVRVAIATATMDMQQYIERKEREAWKAAQGGRK